MKRIILIAAVSLLLILTACSKQEPPAETELPPTEAPTDAPYIDAQLNEPEWTLAEGELQLEDSDNIYAESGDILYFAIVTENDGEQELRFRLNDETAQMLTAQSPDNRYYVTLNGEKIGDATLSDDCTVIVITKENAVDHLTTLASKIRGLAE